MGKMYFTLQAVLLVSSLTCAVRIIVKKCPVTETAWKARAQDFTCKSPLVYHCIQDQKKNLIETCMEVYHIQPLYEGDGCPWAAYFTDGDSILGSGFYTCNGTGCPQKNDSGYSTNQLYKYPRCLHHYEVTTEAVKSTKSVLNVTQSTVNDEKDTVNLVIIGIVSTALVMILVFGVAAFIWKYRRRLNWRIWSILNQDNVARNSAVVDIARLSDASKTPLISKDQNSDHKNNENNVSIEMHKLCQKGDFLKVKDLIHKAEKRLNIKDNNGRTLLHNAGFSGSVELVQYLIDNGCDVYSKDNDGQTIVTKACQEGHVSLVKHLIGIDKSLLDTEDKHGMTPFHCVGLSGSVELVQYLIDNGCDVYSKDNDSRTIVHNACWKRHFKLVKHLLDKDKGVLKPKDNNGRTPFHYAGYSGSVELVQYLIDNGCDVYSKDNTGQAIVHNACQKGHVNLLKHLVDKDKDLLHINDNNGMTPFHCAGFSGSVKLVQYLIDNGCDMYSKDNVGNTIVHFACQEGNFKVVKYLISKDKKIINIKGNNGLTPFHCAGYSGSVELVQYLIDYGCDMYSKDDFGRTILHTACQEGYASLVKHLIDKNRRILNIKDKSGLTAFHVAGFSGSVEIVQYLIDNGCDVYSKSNYGRTILHSACDKGHVDLMKHLIGKGEGVLNIRDNGGLTPFHCAGFSGSVELVQYLIDNGCDVYSKDHDGQTIVHKACQKGHVSLVKHLIDKDKGVLKLKDNDGKTPVDCAELSGSSCLVDYLRNVVCE